MTEKCLDDLAVSMFLEGALTPDESKNIAAHLETCSLCREVLKKLESENAALKEIFLKTAAPDSPDLVPRVMKELETAASPETPGLIPLPLQPRKTKLIDLLSYRWVWATAAVFLLAAFLAIWTLLPGQKPPRKTPEKNVILCSARVEGQEVQSHIYDSQEPDIQFIWLEKEK